VATLVFLDPIWKLDAHEIADRVRDGEVSAKEVLETFVERIERYNEELNAIVHIDLDGARAQAAAIDQRIAQGEEVGALAGVPLGIKELELVEGMPATHASVPHSDKIAERDGVQTARLRKAGAVVVGLTASPEFGSTAHTRTYLHGTTFNPWNLERTPGGSSGGSAAAVAAAILPIASGSDGGGSIRIPAAYSGLFGAKGTFGRIPKGSGPEASLTTAFGCLSRSVRDTARYWDCVVGADERDQYSLPHPGLSYEATLGELPKGLRVTWSDDLGFGACEPEVSGIARAAAAELAEIGEMTWVDRLVELKDMSVGWGLFNHPGTWLDVRDYWPDRADDFTPPVRAGVRDGERRFSMPEYARAIERRHENNVRLAEVFEDVDIICTPTTATTAYGAQGRPPMVIGGKEVGGMTFVTFTFPFNLSGHPAFSIPAGFDAEGLPVALQIVGRRHSDHVLFALCSALEQARPWPKIAPNYE
jgi:Asp-tRNA(Asn)/Glu-tRNA(Gln) amidotransferase A subunit family amidase